MVAVFCDWAQPTCALYSCILNDSFGLFLFHCNMMETLARPKSLQAFAPGHLGIYQVQNPHRKVVFFLWECLPLINRDDWCDYASEIRLIIKQGGV